MTVQEIKNYIDEKEKIIQYEWLKELKNERENE